MKQLKAEFLKIRHTFLIPLHIFVPGIAAVLFLLWTRASARLQFLVYAEAIGIVFPVLASVICAGDVEIELPGHFQGFLMNPGKRESTFLAKWICLQVFAFLAVLGAILLYAVGNFFLLGNTEISAGQFFKTGLILWLGSLPLYLEHLFLNLRFSKAASLAVSIGQLLIATLFLTGIGDGKWQYFPCSWSSRGAAMYLTEQFNRKLPGRLFHMELGNIMICILLGVVLYAIILIWFHFYEGRQENE